MRIISRTGICKEPSSGIHLDVLGPVNFDNTTNLKNTLFLDSASTIEALATSAVANKIRIGVLASTTSIDIGVAAHAKNITIGGPNDTVLIQGTVVTNNATNLNVQDKIITLNKGGAVNSASESGVEFEENNIITSYFRTNAARNAFEMKAPALAGRIALQPGSANFIHTIISTAASDNKIWTLPNTNDTFAGIASAQTLTNKTITSATLNGTTSIAGTALNVSATTTTFTQPVTMQNTVTLTGASLSVSNASTFTGSTTLSGAVTLNNDMLPSGSRTIGSAGLRLANVFTTLLNVSGTATFSSTISGSVSGSAATLTTSRLLWGNSFNGSANVTGVIQGAAGTASAPGYTFSSDTNTGIFRPLVNTVAISTNGFERLRINASGLVGIGNVSPLALLHVSGSFRSNAAVVQNLSPQTNNSGFVGTGGSVFNSGRFTDFYVNNNLHIQQNNATGSGIKFADDGDIVDMNDGSCAVRFSTGLKVYSGPYGGSPVIHLEQNGRIWTRGMSVQDGSSGVHDIGSSGNRFGTIWTSGANTAGTLQVQRIHVLGAPNNNIGEIAARFNTVYALTFNSPSDERLKVNIQESQPVLNKLTQIPVKTWGSKYEDYPVGNIGIIAQDLKKHFPDFVVEEKEDIYDIEKPLSVLTMSSGFISILLKGIQELKQELDEAKAEIENLKSQ